jgi:hypothetical protein
LLWSDHDGKDSDIAALLSSIESLAVSTGAAVAMAGHFAKGNAAAKETIDRISGSGVFARDPDSLITFTKHEEEGAFTVEMILRTLPPVEPFVVQWDWPLFRHAENLDPTKLKQAGGRPPKHTPETLLECLGKQRLKASEWEKVAKEEFGMSRTRFFELKTELETAKKIAKSPVDDKWQQIQPKSGNWYDENDQ